jgi:hypothetical protein
MHKFAERSCLHQCRRAAFLHEAINLVQKNKIKQNELIDITTEGTTTWQRFGFTCKPLHSSLLVERCSLR